MTYFQKQDLFLQRMIEDYKRGLIGSSFEKYFEWKSSHIGRVSFSKKEAYQMIKEAQKELEIYYEKHPSAYDNISNSVNDEDPWDRYKGFEEDKYIVSYLEGISEELTNIIGILK